ncbi:hypothetical protein AVEN_151299-1 [Araneus ventricosus]|uniref:Uncharacterized protein n=1 Tax=Araneus ventricosus TaxID=182803 RepID=A0A4Y2RN20_ARAVE|nr:hypothetical protein AVEN_151299-1 [Araneus ventricosus]
MQAMGYWKFGCMWVGREARDAKENRVSSICESGSFSLRLNIQDNSTPLKWSLHVTPFIRPFISVNYSRPLHGNQIYPLPDILICSVNVSLDYTQSLLSTYFHPAGFPHPRSGSTHSKCCGVGRVEYSMGKSTSFMSNFTIQARICRGTTPFVWHEVIVNGQPERVVGEDDVQSIFSILTICFEATRNLFCDRLHIFISGQVTMTTSEITPNAPVFPVTPTGNA